MIRVLFRQNSHVQEDIAERVWPADPIAAAHVDDLSFGNNSSTGELERFSFLILDRPLFDGLDNRSCFGKGVGIFPRVEAYRLPGPSLAL